LTIARRNAMLLSDAIPRSITEMRSAFPILLLDLLSDLLNRARIRPVFRHPGTFTSVAAIPTPLPFSDGW
jgi:hypothetical protein